MPHAAAHTVDALVVGAGQAGLATSYQLTRLGVNHVILESTAVAAAWASRWKSLHLVTPNHLVTLPGFKLNHPQPEGFISTGTLVDWLRAYAGSFGAPVRTGNTVERISRDGAGFRVVASRESWSARCVVMATGGYGSPRVPALSKGVAAGITQVHSAEFRDAQQLPPGGVLVVGGGQSGVQLASELVTAGRRVTLATGSCGWLPRRYRGRDILSWAHDVGFYSRCIDDLRNPESARHGCNPQMMGSGNGQDLNLATLVAQGAQVVGRLTHAKGHTLGVDDSLEKSLRYGDEYAKNFLNSVDEHIINSGLTCEPAEWHKLPWQGHVQSGQAVRELDLEKMGCTSIIWATGYAHQLSWIEGLPCRDDGYPVHVRGVSPLDGLYFVGLNYQYRRDSSLISGVGADAEYVGSHIASRMKTQGS